MATLCSQILFLASTHKETKQTKRRKKREREGEGEEEKAYKKLRISGNGKLGFTEEA